MKYTDQSLPLLQILQGLQDSLLVKNIRNLENAPDLQASGLRCFIVKKKHANLQNVESPFPSSQALESTIQTILRRNLTNVKYVKELFA